MKSWYKSHIFINTFYRVAMSPSLVEKKKGLGEWGRKHLEMARAVGINEGDPDFLAQFRFLSDIFRQLTDVLGRVPTRDEFIVTWDSWKDTMIKGKHGWAVL